MTTQVILVSTTMEAEREKAERWAREILEGFEYTEAEGELYDWHIQACLFLNSHIRKADPRTPEQIGMDADAADLLATNESVRM